MTTARMFVVTDFVLTLAKSNETDAFTLSDDQIPNVSW